MKKAVKVSDDIRKESELPGDKTEPKVEWKYGACQGCHSLPCPIVAKLVDGKVVKIEGQKIPGLDGRICAKGHALIDQLYRPDRLKYPLRRVGKKGEGKFERITWDEAFSEIAAVLKKYRDEGHPEYLQLAYGCGYVGNLPLFHYFGKVYGTPNFSYHHSDTCSGSGTSASKITGTAGTLGLSPDYANAKYVLEISHNPLGGGTSAHFCTGTFNEAMRKGTKIVVVDPRLSETAAIPGAEWVPIAPNTNGAFLLGVIHTLIADNLYDKKFLQAYTNAPILIQEDGYPLKDAEGNYLVWDTATDGVKPLDGADSPALLGCYQPVVDGSKKVCKTAFQLLADRAATYSPERASEITTVPAAKFKEIAADLGAARPAVTINWNEPHSCFATNSMQEWRLRHILAMLLGNYDVPGGMYLKELNNIQSYLREFAGDTRNIPDIFPFSMPPVKPTPAITAPSVELATDPYSFPCTSGIAKFTRRAILEEKPYPIKAMIVYANALLNTHTHTQAYKRALEKEDFFLVVIDIWPNDHTDYADIVLPDACSLERLEAFTAQWNGGSVKVVAPLLPVVEPMHDTRDVADIYIGLAEKLGLKEYFDFTKEEWFDAQLKGLGIDKKYLEEHGAYYEAGEPTYNRFPYQYKPQTPTERLEIYSTLPSVLKLFKETKDPHADPLPNHVPMVIGEPSGDNEFYLLSAKAAITETSLSQDNAYLMEEHVDGLGLTKLWINADKASKLGIKDDDLVRIWSEATGGEGLIRAKVTEGLHPSSVFAFVGFGHKAKHMSVAKGKAGINVNEFIPDFMELVSGAAACQEALVKIEKAE
ncbi:molybdopterin oxidoreductase [Desulfosarcina ovata subsp. sediminis]|uniref:Molybdopterin oxidoreductase n=1 Tax=Desulfosarcina ovata subsp. sediminis TaxID=885957 RepID=A0A5K7ZY83_9BACT|nr:molybdopterin-dependent oxidoreductase [Desulfosarcina ovata]BBO85222.1 molybdopterin oxidoreductase [Desulfosarcina ovata subsp. sediminis]